MSRVKEPMVRAKWYCGHYVGPANWKLYDDWVFEPDECGTEFETEHEKSEWDEEVVEVPCPKCGAKLTREWDNPEVVGEKP